MRNERANLPRPIATPQNPCKVDAGRNDHFIDNGTGSIFQNATFTVHGMEKHCVFSPSSAELGSESKPVSSDKSHVNQHIRSIASGDWLSFCNSVRVIVTLFDPIRGPLAVDRLAGTEHGIRAVPTRN